MRFGRHLAAVSGLVRSWSVADECFPGKKHDGFQISDLFREFSPINRNFDPHYLNKDEMQPVAVEKPTSIPDSLSLRKHAADGVAIPRPGCASTTIRPSYWCFVLISSTLST
jgi:hypothetical protein